MLIVVHYCYRFLCTVVTDSCALLLLFSVHSIYHFLCTRDFCLQHPVSQHDLPLRLLTLDIVRYYLALVPAVTASETMAAFITFIPLTMASEAIVDHLLRATIYALF